MQEGENEHQLSLPQFDFAIVGEVLDDRGEAAVEFIGHKAEKVISAVYDPDTFKLQLDKTLFHADDADSGLNFLSGRSIVLEASTLGFVEILLFTRNLWKTSTDRISFLYV